MTSPAHHEATKAAIEAVTEWAAEKSGVPAHKFILSTSTTRAIEDAARIAYDMGRRDALNEAAVDRLKAENEQLHAELRHYRTGQPRSVQP